MASTAQDTPTLVQPTSGLAVSTASPSRASPPASQQHDPHNPAPPHTLPKPPTLTSLKQYNIPKFELTGAAAMADNRRHEEEMRSQAAQMTSPNPAKTALMTNSTNAMSRPGDAPSSSPAANKPPSPAPPAKNAIVAEPMQIDNDQPDGPVVTSSPEPAANLGSASDTTGRNDSRKRPASPTSKHDDRSNKAFTYPPPPEPELPTPVRNMSLPNAGTRSPSTKKHRCPHCATEFTRHHNLKSHLLTHSQEKPYGCEQCSLRFRRLHDLKRHLKLHTGERPHTCNICGRKFARGDALARHNKGPGGCAGRRESAGGDDDDGDLEGDVDMDGQYEESPEGLSNDEQSADPHRRKSEPNKRARRTSSRVDPHGGNFRHSSTYPPVAPPTHDQRGEMPPPGSGSNAHPRDAPSQRHLSPHPQGTSFNAVHYNGPSSTYSHSGMTESPRPISPGQPDPNRHNSDASTGRNRSPSLATKLQHQHFGRSTGGNTPPVSLPPPVASHPQLPSIAGFDSRFNGPAYQSNSTSSYRPPVVSTQRHSGSSASPSTPSHHQSSGGSTREVFGGGFQQDEGRFMDYVRSMETRLHEEKTARAAEKEERDNVIRMLQHEIDMLKSRIPEAQHQHGHRSSH